MFKCSEYNENSRKEIINIVVSSINDLLDNEKKLFTYGTSERSKAFHFARILYTHLASSIFKEYELDFEYNRNVANNGKVEKFTEEDAKLIIYEGKESKTYPDIIIHERGTNDNNLLVIEIKCTENHNKSGYDNDAWKLRAFTEQNGVNPYKYKLGLHIVLDKDRSKTYINIYENGKDNKEKINLNYKG